MAFILMKGNNRGGGTISELHIFGKRPYNFLFFPHEVRIDYNLISGAKFEPKLQIRSKIFIQASSIFKYIVVI